MRLRLVAAIARMTMRVNSVIRKRLPVNAAYTGTRARKRSRTATTALRGVTAKLMSISRPSCPAQAGHPVTTEKAMEALSCFLANAEDTGSPAFAGDDNQNFR